jgi:orotate phosphoribosyltransferase
MTSGKRTAQYLLQSKAIMLEPSKPFTWASGWKSPIYCDNRRTLSFPEIRSYIKEELILLVKAMYPGVDVIAGVATGGIAQGALVADELELPFVYVRPAPKGHGMENLIEGSLEAGKKVVVIEDLISTGNSSLNAVEALRQAGCDVLGMVAIFTYGFGLAEENFANAQCPLNTLTNYQELLVLAKESGYIKEQDVPLLEKWRTSPSTWGK